jgi:hypothetical protein
MKTTHFFLSVCILATASILFMWACNSDSPTNQDEAIGKVALAQEPGSFCIENCGVCMQGECMELTETGYLGCVPDTITPDNCAEEGCEGNATCWLLNEEESACLANCHLGLSCEHGGECQEVADGYLGCLEDGEIPPGAPPDCEEEGCEGNFTCWLIESPPSEHVGAPKTLDNQDDQGEDENDQ